MTTTRKSRTTTIRTVGLVIAMVTLWISLGLARPVLAGEQVPFRGTLDAVVNVTPINPPVVSVRIAGAGNASHVGLYTFEFDAVVNQATRTQVGPGAMVITSANGDTITAEGSGGQATLVSPGVLSIVDPATITGGTGRFADATGSFVIRRTFFVAMGVTTGSFAGTISSPGQP